MERRQPSGRILARERTFVFEHGRLCPLWTFSQRHRNSGVDKFGWRVDLVNRGTSFNRFGSEFSELLLDEFVRLCRALRFEPNFGQ